MDSERGNTLLSAARIVISTDKSNADVSASLLTNSFEYG